MSQRGGHSFIAFYALYNSTRALSFFLLPLYFVSVGVPVIQVGFAIAAFGVSILVFEFLWGVLFDRLGAGRLVFAAVAMNAAVYAIIPMVRSAEGAVAVEFLLGACGPIFPLVARARVVQVSEPSGWARGFGVMGAVYSLGQVAGSILSSLAAPSFGIPECFYVSGALSVAGYLVYLRASPRGGPPSVRAASTGAPGTDSRPRLDWRGLPLLGLVAVPAFISFIFFTTIIQLVVTQTPSISATEFEAGVVVSAFWLGNGLLQPVLASRGAGRARFWIALALLGSFLVFALMTQLYDVWELAAASFLAAVCFAVISPLSLSLLMVGIPGRYVGRAMGIYGSAEDVGVIIGPVLGSAVWVQFGLTDAYLVMGSTFLMVLAPFLVAMWRPGPVAKG